MTGRDYSTYKGTTGRRPAAQKQRKKDNAGEGEGRERREKKRRKGGKERRGNAICA